MLCFIVLHGFKRANIYKQCPSSMINVISMNKMKIKTVMMNARGVIVIPQEIREDLQLENGASLVLIETNNEIILKKEEDVARALTNHEDKIWKKLSEESLKRAWEKEDEVWDKLAKKLK